MENIKKIKSEIEIISGKIEFIQVDIRFYELQLELGYKIVNVIQEVKNHPIFPSMIGYQATSSYQKMDDTDRDGINKYIESQKEKLSELKAKQTIELSFNEKQNEKDIEKN